MRWFLLIIFGVVLLIVGISVYLQPNDFIGCGKSPRTSGTRCIKADAIVVISGGDTSARTAEGIQLFDNGWADALVLSGAAQDKTGPSNAAAMRLQAIEAGVPKDAIYIEENGATTQQNAVKSKTIFEQHDFNDVILVTSGYHQRRSALAFDKVAGTTKVLNHPLLSDKDWSFFWWLSPRGWWLAGGELVKIAAFYIGASS